jgi:hypothetical protein
MERQRHEEETKAEGRTGKRKQNSKLYRTSTLGVHSESISTKIRCFGNSQASLLVHSFYCAAWPTSRLHLKANTSQLSGVYRKPTFQIRATDKVLKLVLYLQCSP